MGDVYVSPSGAKDENVFIEVVTGVNRDAIECRPNNYDGCIHKTHGPIAFVPGAEHTVEFQLQRSCLDRNCPNGQTCDHGLCYPVGSIPNDGGIPDAAATEASTPDGGPVPPPPPADAGDPDACAGCPGTCDNRSGCTIICGGSVDCTSATTRCPPNLPCDVTCNGDQDCEGFQCVTSQDCKMRCTGQDACKGALCAAKTCDITCGDSACSNVKMDAGTSATITCSSTGSGNACNNVECFVAATAGRCTGNCSHPPNCQMMDCCIDPARCAGNAMWAQTCP